ncbi:pro-sigmaK processing inhibitor BofA family protein [Ruminococcaceae bacterium OttesenSCG-928-N02]|nr:pro-sigmaK processing inhibitor BofA family protein [Ruminococcaceae bacterium OttesenSCG-928-N02]
MVYIFVAAGLITLFSVSAVASKSRRPVLTSLGSALLGAGGLAVVNLLGGFTGVVLPVNFVTGFTAAVLSLPGVITLLIMQLFMHV